jgi:hypothetical protein
MNNEEQMMDGLAERAKAYNAKPKDEAAAKTRDDLRKEIASYITRQQAESIEKNSADLEIGESAHTAEEWEELLKNSEGLRKLVAARLLESRDDNRWEFL